MGHAAYSSYEDDDDLLLFVQYVFIDVLWLLINGDRTYAVSLLRSYEVIAVQLAKFNAYDAVLNN